MVVTVLLTMVFIGILALAIDISATRSRASELQRIADSAALAAAAGLPDLTRAQQLAAESALRNDPSGKSTVVVNRVANRAGRLVATATDSNVRASFIQRTSSITRTAFSEQAVGIPMGTPYNSIGTGDLPGFIPGAPLAKQGYFLAINGPCTAKEDGDRFMSMFDGIRGSLASPAGHNTDAYHCADYDAVGHLWTDGIGNSFTGTAKSQWANNSEYRPGGYSFIVDVPCNSGATPCPRRTFWRGQGFRRVPQQRSPPAPTQIASSTRCRSPTRKTTTRPSALA
jgi:Putative Flp pilus-assembly TadE/G-like